MRKFNMIQNTSGWPAVYEQSVGIFGQAKADAIFDRALELTEKYENDYRDSNGIHRMHIMAAIAEGSLYLPLKEELGPEKAARILEEAAKPTAVAKHNKIERLPPHLFIKVAGLITSTMFGEKAGFKRKWHCNTAAEKRFDLLTCPYVEVLTKMGCPEVCPSICIQDEYSFSGMKNGVLFERTKTLGRGDNCCDFCYRIP